MKRPVRPSISANELVENARAKVNLTLRVVGRRVDGYHDLESVVAFADCADQLSLLPGAELALKTTGPLAEACGEVGDNLVLKAARLLAERVPGLKTGTFSLTRCCPSRPGSAADPRTPRRRCGCSRALNGLPISDARITEVAKLTGADVPVCVPSQPCVMTGVGESLMPLDLPKLPCVLINPRVAVATKDVFAALGLRNGELLVGFADVLQAMVWPEAGASLEDWVEAFAASSNDLEAPAMRIQPVIGEVISAPERDRRRLARAHVGLGSYVLCDLREHRRRRPRGGQNSPRSSAVVGAFGRLELKLCFTAERREASNPEFRDELTEAAAGQRLNAFAPGRTPPLAQARSSSGKPEKAPAHRPPSRRNAARG